MDYKALVGDASDSLPGVLGIGAKTAEKLLKEHGPTLDNAAVDKCVFTWVQSRVCR